MKFEMTVTEFNAFCAHMQQGARLPQLENELSLVRSELESTNEAYSSARDDRDYIQRRLDRSVNENDELLRTQGEVSREIRALKNEIQVLQDKLVPHRVERAYSRAFSLQLTGQKIMAIKEIRALLNIGLKEAKDVVEGAFTDSHYSNLITLSTIFYHLGKDDGFEVQQREGLAKLLPAAHSDADLDSILAGTFQNVTPEQAPNSSTD